MDVLNTSGGAPITEFTGWGIVLIIVFFIALVIVSGSVQAESFGGFLFGLAIAVIIVVIKLNGGLERETGELTPIRHEVTLRPGYVIDAKKYEIVEQRGQIYVIEERRVSE